MREYNGRMHAIPKSELGARAEQQLAPSALLNPRHDSEIHEHRKAGDAAHRTGACRRSFGHMRACHHVVNATLTSTRETLTIRSPCTAVCFCVTAMFRGAVP